MELITENDVLRLANALSVKTDLNISLVKASQCTSDFLLTVYHAIMGELPLGVLSECVSLDSQQHNVKCVVDTLADEYLHVDLSHISPQYFISGDPTTVYNLLEILDGLLDFMLDQISNDLDSGDEGDIDSDVLSEKRLAATWGGSEQRYNSDPDLNSSTCTADLIALDLDSERPSVTALHQEALVPNKKLFSSDTEWEELKSAGSISEHALRSDGSVSEHTLRSDGSISEHTLTSADLNSRASSASIERSSLPVDISDTDKRRDAEALLTKTYRVPDFKRPVPDDDASSLRSSSAGRAAITKDTLKETYTKTTGPPSIDVILDPAQKGSGISVSDVTSVRSDGTVSSSSIVLEIRPRDPSQENETESSRSSSGTDVVDGIPKPVMHDKQNWREEDRPRSSEPPRPPPERDWAAMLSNLQKTVEESRKIREKYFAAPHDEAARSETQASESDPGSRDSHRARESSVDDTEDDRAAAKRRQRNVRFKDSATSKTAHELKDFRAALERENLLQTIKNKVLSESYRDHLDEVEDNERRKVEPLRKKAGRTERELKARIGQQRQRAAKAETQTSSVKRNLAAAAKWKSWQRPFVRTTPQRRSQPVPSDRKIKGNLEIGEHDLLPILISEFPGLRLSSATLNNAWRKQFRQIEALTSHETSHAKSKRHTEQQLQEAHRRHQLLTDIIRREHDHTMRVREAKERAAGRKETVRKVGERRQQSARVRRYYRDYQQQMRARMLKRKTREEKLFKNLFEEGLTLQRERLRELRKYARDKRTEQQKRQQNEIASLENYYKDQFTVLAETLQSEKTELRMRDKAQTDLLRRMKSGLRVKMEREIEELQDRIVRDDEEMYFRELEADRIRRQLQLATYHSKFSGSLAQSM